MSTFWNRLQRLDSDVKGALDTFEFLDRIEGNTKTEKKIVKFPDFLYFLGTNETLDLEQSEFFIKLFVSVPVELHKPS